MPALAEAVKSIKNVAESNDDRRVNIVSLQEVFPYEYNRFFFFHG